MAYYDFPILQPFSAGILQPCLMTPAKHFVCVFPLGKLMGMEKTRASSRKNPPGLPMISGWFFFGHRTMMLLAMIEMAQRVYQPIGNITKV